MCKTFVPKLNTKIRERKLKLKLKQIKIPTEAYGKDRGMKMDGMKNKVRALKSPVI